MGMRFVIVITLLGACVSEPITIEDSEDVAGVDAELRRRRRRRDAGTPLPHDAGVIAQVDAAPPPPPPPMDAGLPPRDAAPSPSDAAMPPDAGSPRRCGPGYEPVATRDARRWPFASSSPWNTPIGSGARYGDGTDACSRDLTDPSVITWINSTEWSHPIYLARDTDPLVPIYEGGTFRLNARSPVSATPALPRVETQPWTDSHLHLIDPTGRWVDEMWRAFPRAGGGWNADGYARNDLFGSGVGAGGVRAYGGSAIGGLVRTGEIGTGIRHALAFGQPRAKQRRGFVWPAIWEDNGSAGTYLGNVPMGQLIAIPPDIDLCALGLHPAALSIAIALQDFGAYDVDSAGGFAFYSEPAADPETSPALRDIARVRSLLRCVTNNGPSNVGGGGTPRAPLAPPL